MDHSLAARAALDAESMHQCKFKRPIPPSFGCGLGALASHGRASRCDFHRTLLAPFQTSATGGLGGVFVFATVPQGHQEVFTR